MHTKSKKIPMTIYLSPEKRAQLQRLAAQQMIKNPQKNFSAGSVATTLLVEYLDKLTMQEDENNEL